MPDMWLSREKTTIYRGGTSPETAKEKTIIGSNRMLVTLRRVTMDGKRSEQYVMVRGKQLPQTIRMSVALLQCFGSLGSITGDMSLRRWQRDWEDGLSPSEKADPEGNWIGVYQDGKCLFDRHAPKEMAAIEEIASGNEIDHRMIRIVTQRLSDLTGEALHVENDSQLAFLLNEGKRGVKVSILDRTHGREGAYHFQLQWNMGRKDRMRDLAIALNAAYTIVDAAALVSLLGRLRREIGAKSGAEAEELRNTIERQEQRIRDLQARLDVLAVQNALDISPRKPNFVADLQVA